MSAPRTCECMTCKKCKAREWARNRYREQAYGRWQPFGDAEAVRRHVAELRAAGVGLRRIAEAAGVSRSCLDRHAYGTSRNITVESAEKILAVTPDAAFRLPAYRVARRLRALSAIGYSTRDLAALIGCTQRDITMHFAGARKWVEPQTLAKVCEVYERLCMTPGGNEVAARIARKRGFPPPLAWDDIDNDAAPAGEVSAHDVIDPAVVARLLAGDRIDSTRAEKVEALRQWMAGGGSQREFCQMHGWKQGRYIERTEDAA